MRRTKTSTFLSIFAFLLLAGASSTASAAPLLPVSEKAEAKRARIWSNILDTEYDLTQLPSEGFGAFDLAKLVIGSFLRVSFTHTSDEMPLGRKKLIHTYGSVAQIHLDTDSRNPFTGLFSTGATGLIRFSLAAQMGAFTPGFALKLFVDGQPSANFHALNSLEGQGKDRNFFAHCFSTHLEEPKNPVLIAGGLAFAHAIKNLAGAPED